jgi:hypothetical protein
MGVWTRIDYLLRIKKRKGFGHEHPIWDVEKVRRLAANQDDEATFFCGGSRNFKQFLDLCDEIFILDVDAETLKEASMTLSAPKVTRTKPRWLPMGIVITVARWVLMTPAIFPLGQGTLGYLSHTRYVW